MNVKQVKSINVLRVMALLFSLLLPISVARGEAEGNNGLPVYLCLKTGVPPPCGAGLHDPGWKDAGLVTGFFRGTTKEAVKVQPLTEFRLRYDKDNLYILLECHEPAMANVKTTTGLRDGPVWEDDCVEIFVQPGEVEREYRHFIVSAAGVVFDGKPRDSGWNSDCKVSVRREEASWISDIRIPLRDLGISSPDDSLVRMNICRERYAGGGQELSAWSPVMKTFHEPDSFAYVILGDLRGNLERETAARRESIGKFLAVVEQGLKENFTIKRAFIGRVSGLKDELQRLERDIERKEEIDEEQWRSCYQRITDLPDRLRKINEEMQFEIILR